MPGAASCSQLLGRQLSGQLFARAARQGARARMLHRNAANAAAANN